MSTPSTGPDEREAEVERIAGLLDELVSEACDLERYSTWDRRAGSEESSRVEIARLQSEVLSALRAARRELDEVREELTEAQAEIQATSEALGSGPYLSISEHARAKLTELDEATIERVVTRRQVDIAEKALRDVRASTTSNDVYMVRDDCHFIASKALENLDELDGQLFVPPILERNDR